jgi:UDP-N-acetylglucosamine 2-epimerase (non-hydrolysing)
MSTKIIHVVGARPNFIKVSPVIRALAQNPTFEQLLVHTGQHYDVNMSKVFFDQLEIPKPDINLDVGSGSHAVQTARIMMAFEDVVQAHRPNWVVVYGDVNSTIAAALVSAKLHISVAHVEAGLRSNDRTMPEEINRILTDQLSDLLFTPSEDGDENLRQEGVADKRIHRVGNVMLDTLRRMMPRIDAVSVPDLPPDFLLVTLHRPSNVDDPVMFGRIMTTLNAISQETPIIFPMHPRTRQRMQDMGITVQTDRLMIWEPVGYLEFLKLQTLSAGVITDSGGVQEETTFLQIPCLTVRPNTERPITITMGTNQLIGDDMNLLMREIEKIRRGEGKRGQIPSLWDGRSGERIAAILAEKVT